MNYREYHYIRVEELKHNEELLYKIISYLIDLWSINESKEEIIEHFKYIGFTSEDIKKLDIENIYF